MSQGSIEEMKATNTEIKFQLLAVVYGKCHDVGSKAEVDAQARRIANELGMSDADWADAGNYATRDRGQIMNGSAKVINGKAAWAERDPVDQFATFAYPQLTANHLGSTMDIFYLADLLGPKLTATGRLGYVNECLKSENPAVWALCQGDIAALDYGKIAEEIRADKAHSGFTRMVVRLRAHDIKAEITARADAITKLLATDKAWKQLFDIAAEETKTWETRYTSSADLIALTTSMDDALITNSRSATEGCEDKTWAVLADQIKKTPAKAFAVHRQAKVEDVAFTNEVVDSVLSTIIGDPDGYLAATAYAMCHNINDGDRKAGSKHASHSESRASKAKGKGKDVEPEELPANDELAAHLQYRLRQWPGFRGPRTSTLSRIDLADVKFDNRDTKLQTPNETRFWFSSSDRAGESEGVVADVKVEGDAAVISYQSVKVKATVDIGCTQGRLHGIRGDGSLEYEVNCTGSQQVTYDRTREPDTADARFVKGLTKNMDIIWGNGAVVWIAWPKAGAATPSIILGQPVK